MKITFLGTSAANAFPEAYCRCNNCEQAHKLGGANLRKWSAALIKDDLLIDLGPDIMTAATMHAQPLTNVRYCLQTHTHEGNPAHPELATFATRPSYEIAHDRLTVYLHS